MFVKGILFLTVCLWELGRLCADQPTVTYTMEHDALRTFQKFNKKILDGYTCAKNPKKCAKVDLYD